MASKGIEALKELADKDLSLDKSQLDIESVRTPKIHNKWLKMLYDRKDIIFALELKKKSLHRDNWLYYNGKAKDSAYKEKGAFPYKIMKGDLSIFLEADKAMNDLDTKIYVVKSEIEFIQKTIEEINRRSFHITNIQKALSFMNGLNP